MISNHLPAQMSDTIIGCMAFPKFYQLRRVLECPQRVARKLLFGERHSHPPGVTVRATVLVVGGWSFRLP